MPAVDKPILFDMPDVFYTARCIIRAPRAGDGQAMYDAVTESQTEIATWLNWAINYGPPDEQEALVRRGAARYALREDFWLLICERESGRLLGTTGLHRLDWSVPSCEIGYWLRTGETGKGYMTEAVGAVTDIGFGLCAMERIMIRMDVENHASRAVAERCGYQFEGILRAVARRTLDDTVRDHRLYSRVRPEWRPSGILREGDA
ncbi:MAG: N-acetyltransferase [Anaerolineaceae bacterium]|nr:MAG: N-acetyltransferase [Anaerolineaceae bacterium]